METVGTFKGFVNDTEPMSERIRVNPTPEIERAMQKHQYWFDRYLEAKTLHNKHSKKYAMTQSIAAAERLDDLIKKLMITHGI